MSVTSATFDPQPAEPLEPPAIARPSGLAEGPPLTLLELEQMAIAANPTVAEAAARVEALRGKWVQVGLLPNPTLGYMASEMGALGTAGQQGGFVSQQFIRGGKLARSRDVVGWELDQAEQQLAVQQQRVLTDVRIAYYNLAMANRRLSATDEIVRLNGEAVDASRSLMNAGEISQIQLIQAELEAERGQILHSNAAAQRTAAQRHLQIVVGMPASPLPEVDAVVGEPNELHWDDALQQVFAQSPEMAAAFTNLERARAAVDLAYAEAQTDLSVQLSLQRDAVDGDTLTGIQAGLPIPIFNRNQGGIQQAYGDLVAAERAVQGLELQLADRLTVAFRRYQQAREQVRRYAGQMLFKAQEGLDLVTAGYRAGEIDYLTFLTSQRTYFQTQLAYIDALEQLWVATAEIEGLLLSGSLRAGM